MRIKYPSKRNTKGLKNQSKTKTSRSVRVRKGSEKKKMLDELYWLFNYLAILDIQYGASSPNYKGSPTAPGSAMMQWLINLFRINPSVPSDEGSSFYPKALIDLLPDKMPEKPIKHIAEFYKK